jgi:Domain of unknown function (DUF4440)
MFTGNRYSNLEKNAMSENQDTGATDLKSLLTALNERILQAEEAGLTADLATLLHENFTIIRASGVKQDRQAFLDAVPTNATRGRNATEPQVYSVGECAVYTVIVTTTRSADGTPAIGHFWNTRLFVHDQDQWRCAAWQVMKICDA